MEHTSKERENIRLQGSMIVYSLGEDLVWQMPVGDLVVLGECTDPNGPYVDDYFFVFVRRPDYKYWIASFYADGGDKFLDNLGAVLGARLSPGLCHSTEYASRILWPPAIVGTQLFDFESIKPVGMWVRIKQKLIPTYEMGLTKNVVEYLEKNKQTV